MTWAGVVMVLSGPTAVSSIGISVGRVMGIYGVGGVAGGMVVGLLQPWTRSRLGAAVVGGLVGLIVALLIAVAKSGFPPRSSDDYLGSLLFALAVGIPGGLMYREIFWGRNRSD